MYTAGIVNTRTRVVSQHLGVVYALHSQGVIISSGYTVFTKLCDRYFAAVHSSDNIEYSVVLIQAVVRGVPRGK